MRSKILAGTIIFGLLAVIALGIVAASPNSQATTPTPTATPTPSEEAYNLLIAAIGEALPPAKDILYVRLTDLLIEKVIAPNSSQTPTQIKTGILAGLDNPTVTETLIATLKVADPDAVIANSFADFFIGFIADSTGETAAEVRARLSTPATPTPTPTPTGSATATPSPTPTPTGSPTATPPPTPTPVSTGAMLDIWEWGKTLSGNQNMVITWDATTLVRRASKMGDDGGDYEGALVPPPHTSDTTHSTYNPAINDSTDSINAFTNTTPTNDQKLAEYIYRARLYFDTGQYAEAAADFKSAIALNPTSDTSPDDNQLRNLMGIAYAFGESYAEAEAEFTSVLESKASTATRGAAGNNRSVVKALQGKYGSALTDYKNAIDILKIDMGTGEAISYNNRGSTLIKWDRPDSGRNCDSDTNTTESDLDCAIADFVSAIGVNNVGQTQKARFENNLGLAHRARVKTDTSHNCDSNTTTTESALDCAIIYFGAAIESADDNTAEEARFQNNLGLAHKARDNDFDGTNDNCSNAGVAEDSDLDCAIAYFTLAYTYAGDEPDHATFLNNRGIAHIAREETNGGRNCDNDANTTDRDLDCAIADFTKAITTYGGSNDPDIYNNRGLAYRARKNEADPANNIKSDTDLAILDFTSAIGLRADADFYYNRGLAYRAKNDTGRAINDFTNAIKRNPANSDFYTERGNAYTANGQDTKAGQDLVFATKIKSSSVRCSDFQDFDTTYGTSFGSDRAAANAFYQAAMKEGYSQSGLNALKTGSAVCPSL